ncbi:ATP-grasp fold amidoligase family protein [Marinicellulosiphila megalodicopiae]|uniref:ATP-grasp fold amidoligase family protein n=1 Tax=Marinicellulosiphila megalodicopiae TaxID=2724896 RepID=UPI003BB08BF7
MKYVLKKIVTFLPNKWQIFLNFKMRVGYFPSLNNPKSFNEKIQHRKLNDNNPLFPICSDKLKVRDYVSEKIGAQYLIPLLFDGNDISIEQLKNIEGDYVVKTTHDSGGVFVVEKSQENDFNQIKKGLDKSLQHDFGKEVSEFWYSKIQPKIIVEKMLKDKEGSVPKDYKFHVFKNNNQTRIYLQIDYDRFTTHNRSLYDENLNLIPISWHKQNNFIELQKTKNHETMLNLVKQLAVDFNYVRVDLYNVDGQIYFGELTFAAESGFGRFSDKKFDFELGNYWG